MNEDPNRAASLPGIARRLKASRLAVGLNQTDFCTRAGIAKNTYNQWEGGKGRPGLTEAIKLCTTHSLSLDWIYFGNPAALPFGLAQTIKDQLMALERLPSPSKPMRPMRRKAS